MEFIQVAPGTLTSTVQAAPIIEDKIIETQATPPAPASPSASKEDEAKQLRMAQMIQRKKQMLNEKRFLAQEKQKIAQERAEIDAFKVAKEKAKVDPDGYLKAGGLTYEELVQYYLDGKKVSPEAQITSVRDEIERFKQEMEQKEQLKLQQQQMIAQREAEGAVNSFKEKIGDFVHSNSDKYELINKEGEEAQEAVFDYVEEHFKRTGKILSIEQAADLVEQFIEDRFAGYKEVKKFSKYFQPSQPGAEKNDSARSGERKSLNNMNTASAAASVLTPQLEGDRMRRALAKLDSGA